MAHYRLAAVAEPSQLTELLRAGRRACLDDRPDDGLAVAELALELDPTYARAHIDALACHARLGNRGGTLAALECYALARQGLDSSLTVEHVEGLRVRLAEGDARVAFRDAATEDRTHAREFAVLADLAGRSCRTSHT